MIKYCCCLYVSVSDPCIGQRMFHCVIVFTIVFIISKYCIGSAIFALLKHVLTHVSAILLGFTVDVMCVLLVCLL